MVEAAFDVTGIGNAIVDVLTRTTDSFLEENRLVKGVMTLIDAAQADDLYDRMGPAIECSGGSAANTMAALASMGGRAAFVGKVADDQLGKVFRHDIKAIGVDYATTPLAGGDPPTARCLVFVTPDAHRTMYTYLGACTRLAPADIDEGRIAASKVTYLEGYQWDAPKAKDALVKAALAAREAGRKVALTLSDPMCVERHRREFGELVDGLVDILFANEAEIASLYQADDFQTALDHVRGLCPIAVLTRSEKGSVVVTDSATHEVGAEPVDNVMDTTGAGDAYAAGFLYGYTQGRPLDVCARMGAIAAAEIISHYGARPETELAGLVARAAE